jgi:N-acetylglucosamine-6-sulfatase
LLHEIGYETAYIGKWHMGLDDSPRPGFDYWFSVKGQGQYFDPPVNEDGQSKVERGYVTDIFNQRAVSFIQRARSRPFCLYLAHKAVHPDMTQHADGTTTPVGPGGFRPAERHRKLYAGAQPRRRPNYGRAPAGKPALLRKIGDLPPLGPETVTDDETIRNRLRLLAGVDEGAGMIFEALQRSGQLDNTVLMFAGDNGYFYGEHGLSAERRLAYEESIRVPLLVRYPVVVKPGSRPEQYALNIDVAPTLLDFAGAGVPAHIQGRSLRPVLAGSKPDWRRSFLMEYYSDIVFPRVYRMGYEAVRTERWKYIRYRELSGMDELYDLRADPYEMRNLITEPAAAAGLAEARAELDRLAGTIGKT